MDFGLRRSNVPLWPPSRQGTYENLSSGEDLPLQDTPTPGTAMSAQYKSLMTPGMTPSPGPYTPGYQDSAANTPAVEQLRYDSEKPKSRWFGMGWRGGARMAFYSTCAVLVVNIFLLVYFVSPKFEKMAGFPVIYRGTCADAELQNRLWHLLLNVLSTGLLAASNYCMQLLCAPNRTNIDAAHAHGVWLDIGIPSLRNLRFVAWKRRVLWLALLFSSLPLHLVYNSTFYAAISTNNYNVLYVTSDFLNGGQYDAIKFPDSLALNVSAIQLGASNMNAPYKSYENAECVKNYAEDFITEFKNVVVVVSNVSQGTSGSLLDVYINDLPATADFSAKYNSFPWICNDVIDDVVQSRSTPCRDRSRNIQSKANTQWMSGGYDVSYCVAERVEKPDCHLHFAPHLMGPVVLMNIVKCLVAFYVAFRLRDAPLVTLGDAIQSFIKHPDPYTRGMCLATAEEMSHQFSRATNHTPILRSTIFNPTRHRWYKVVSKKQWALLFLLFAFMICSLLAGIILGTRELNPPTWQNAMSVGLSTIEAQNLIFGAQNKTLGATGVLVTALLANLPQAILSFLYMFYNTVFTLMQIGEDWDMFGAYTDTTRHKLQLAAKKQTHRYLRVSDPKGTQKSTHSLNLPLRYAVPLLCVSGIIHWLASQTLYLANVSVTNRDDTKPKTDEITTVAYAPLGMVALLAIAIGMITVIVINSLRRYGGQMPIVGSNSAAISAACHVQMPERRRRELVLRKIAWGEIPTNGGNVPTTTADRRLSALSVASGLGIDHGFKNSTVYSAKDFSDVIDRDEEYGGDDDSSSEYRSLRGPAEMVDLDSNGVGRSTAVAHCTFSDSFVFKGEAGKFYA